MKRNLKSKIPNILTLFRIIVIPFFIISTVTGSYKLALLLFVIAAFTDTIDGIIARRFGYVSDFGKVVDPLADKLLVASALILLTYLGLVYWWLTALILAREILITILRYRLTKNKVYLPANVFGKMKTTTQVGAIIFAFFYIAFLAQSPTIEIVILVVFLIATVLTWASAIIYLINIRKEKYV
jgi:CDP-diacylglycerol--glycerol-3-phosphate 3-phosphatidyltransferase